MTIISLGFLRLRKHAEDRHPGRAFEKIVILARLKVGAGIQT